VGKKVYELDNHPIKEVYHDYFNHSDDSSASQYLEYPVQISNPDGGTIIRSIADVGEDGFFFSGHIAEGTKIYFCSPSITKTVSSSINAINDFQKANRLMDSDAVLAFSCSARLQSFGFYIQNELRSFNEMWGTKHTGFFSHGEIGCCDDGASNSQHAKLHNNSISVVFFKDLTVAHSSLADSKSIDYHEQKLDVTEVQDKDLVIVKLQEQKLALSNLLQRTSLDLNNALRELDQYRSGLEQKVDAQLTDIKHLHKDIIDTQKEVIFTMGAIAETRSKETGNHVVRVAEYSKVFALQLGLGEEAAELIKQASPMHDIGKVGIPDAILHKPGKLTADEFNIMKTHAELGYTMLNHSKRPILVLAATIANEHHEKWDGTGYPCGLAGEDINLYGRITAIADVFDALGSDRCYKNAWDDQDIWAYFKAQRGKHFAPELIDIFFEHIEVFKEIRQTYRDS
jgi:response regulator RpfG family c-di-GMP phosphodiesterase